MANKPPVNQGDDISGVVHAVGEKVSEFKPGDRVMAFHEMMAPGGSYAEYALSWEHTTFPLPQNCSFQGASLPAHPTVVHPVYRLTFHPSVLQKAQPSPSLP